MSAQLLHTVSKAIFLVTAARSLLRRARRVSDGVAAHLAQRGRVIVPGAGAESLTLHTTQVEMLMYASIVLFPPPLPAAPIFRTRCTLGISSYQARTFAPTKLNMRSSGGIKFLLINRSGSCLASLSIRLVAISAPGGAGPLSEYVPNLTSLAKQKS
ncbi:hypothetical protein KCU76_g64, partial [Aureobasidium melanogenum]